MNIAHSWLTIFPVNEGSSDRSLKWINVKVKGFTPGKVSSHMYTSSSLPRIQNTILSYKMSPVLSADSDTRSGPCSCKNAQKTGKFSFLSIKKKKKFCTWKNIILNMILLRTDPTTHVDCIGNVPNEAMTSPCSLEMFF